MKELADLGCENLVASFKEPMPGSDPEVDLGHLWVRAIGAEIKRAVTVPTGTRIVIVLEHLAALFPASGPRALMQELWDSEQSSLEGPVVVLIPGTLHQSRVYSFVNQREEFMYRGDIL